MGLLQKAVETYDAMVHLVGKYDEKEREPLAPVSHIIARAQLDITLNGDGSFLSARAVDKNESKIIIPATEASAGRTVKAAELPHPLCDYLRYLLPYNRTEYGCYVKQLSDWADSEFSSPKLRAVLRYVQGGTILSDLAAAGLIDPGTDGRLKDEKSEKMIVRWTVNGLGEGESGPCWEDKALMMAFSDYVVSRRADAAPELCMISGETESPAAQHPKGIVPANGNAKLISANDSGGFTYRGRFTEDRQAATVGYTASQKAHCALRWLVANEGVTCGGRTFVCWSPAGAPTPKITNPMIREKTRAADPTQYRSQLLKALHGFKESLPEREGVVIAAFDAATTGRLALTYYGELMSSDFLQRLYDWDNTCCWDNGFYGIQSPYLYNIVSLAFGALRGTRVEADERILGQQMQRLVACRIDKTAFPIDIERALVEKASNLRIYPRSAGADGEASAVRQKLLFTACACIRKYHIDQFKEEWNMALDKDNTDRSYLFGRLLAIAEALEDSTYTDEGRRETNAMRMQKMFTLRPMETWRVLWEKLRPYAKSLGQLKPGLLRYYNRAVDEIMDKFSPDDSALNQKLEDIYLLGYSHQRAYRREKPEEQAAEQE